jgi:hypothetical protein
LEDGAQRCDVCHAATRSAYRDHRGSRSDWPCCHCACPTRVTGIRCRGYGHPDTTGDSHPANIDPWFSANRHSNLPAQQGRAADSDSSGHHRRDASAFGSHADSNRDGGADYPAHANRDPVAHGHTASNGDPTAHGDTDAARRADVGSRS